ncbi:hypothetical protein [Desulfofustis limnaeus]|jgi:hypothetical protein|nr:hypothetical protein [Desulfofustis limnaeus]MDX9896297.1 hypothetical protein [Desulfofustis sp.]
MRRTRIEPACFLSTLAKDESTMQLKTTALATVITITLLIGFTRPASAAESLGIAAKAGTVGFGAEVSISLLPHTRLRGGLNYLDYSFESTIDDIDYEFDPQYNSASLIVDVHPFAGTFFVSGGIFLNNNSVDVNGTLDRGAFPAAYYGYSFLADLVSISGEVEFNPIAPYAGLGWRTNSEDSGWGFAVELGVMFQGAPDVKNLRVNAPIDVNGNDEVQRFLAEQEQEIEDELEWFEFYPVASAMLTYHF